MTEENPPPTDPGTNKAEADPPADPPIIAEGETTPEVLPETKGAPTEEALTEEAPTEEAPTEEAPTEEAPTEKAPTEKAATEETPTDEEGGDKELPSSDKPSPPDHVSKTSLTDKKTPTPEKTPTPDKVTPPIKEPGIQQLFDSKGSLLQTESIVKEKLEYFKKQRASLALLIGELQEKVKAYKEKPNPTDDDIANLKTYHTAFLAKLAEYEELTRNVEKLMGMKGVPTAQLDLKMSGPPMPKPPPPTSKVPKESAEKPQTPKVETNLEDKLPKLIVCGTDMGDSVPRIIVCEPLRRADLEPFGGTVSPKDGRPEGSPDTGVVGKPNDTGVVGKLNDTGEVSKLNDPGVVGKLNDSIEAQKRLAAENAEMAKLRHQLQGELLDKQDMLDSMKQRMMALESEKYRIEMENAELQKQLLLNQKPGSPPMCKRELYMKFRGQLPDETPQKPFCSTGNTQNLEQELEKMGGDVEIICCELENLQKEKMALGYSTSQKQPVNKAMDKELQKMDGDIKNSFSMFSNLQKGMGLGYPSSQKQPICKRMLPQKSTQTDKDKEKDVFFESDKDPKYKDLREQYKRLHNDFKNKVTEVAALRVDLDKTKTELDGLTILHHELEAMHQKELDQNNALQSEKKQLQSFKDQILDLEQQANLAKQMYKNSQEEMEEMRALIEEQATQLDDYRNKYMKTLQIAEELKKENEFKERECADQVAVEIQRVKLEMQEQLEELSPIKDLLKITQQKLKETEQMHTIALETIADMSQKLEDAKNEIENLKNRVNSTEAKGDLTANLKESLDQAEKKMNKLEAENARLKESVSQLETLQANQNQRLDEKTQEVLQLVSQLDTLREESARQVARVKERSEMIRKCLQAQIAEMEREVAQCRATAAFASRERDEIRSKLQLEICLLSENFRESQNRIVQLQQHVNYLSASHPTNFIDLVK